MYASHIGSKTSGRFFFSMFIISVLKMEHSPGSHYYTSTLPSALPISQLSVDQFLKYRLIVETDSTMSLWISNNTCLADDTMLPVLHSGELWAAELRFAHPRVLMNINTGLFRVHTPFKITWISWVLLCSMNSFWESPHLTFRGVVNALLIQFFRHTKNGP